MKMTKIAYMRAFMNNKFLHANNKKKWIKKILFSMISHKKLIAIHQKAIEVCVCMCKFRWPGFYNALYGWNRYIVSNKRFTIYCYGFLSGFVMQ